MGQWVCFAVLLPTGENAMAQCEHVTVALVSGKEVAVPATVAWSERAGVWESRVWKSEILHAKP